MLIRKELPEDIFLVDELYKTNPLKQEKGDLLKKLRKSVKYDADLSFVAELDGEVIAHILYFPISVSHNRCRNWTLTIGASVIRKDLKQKGYFTELLKSTLELLKTREFKSVLVHGHPLFYHRFGFENCEKYGMILPEEKKKENLEMLALSLRENALLGMEGSIQFTHEFN